MDKTPAEPAAATEAKQSTTEEPAAAASVPGELDEQALDAVSGGTRQSSMASTLSNIASMQHEQLKGVIQNLRV